MTKRNNKIINQARINKADEFYTQLSDIENEMKYYKDRFKNKIVYCNCDIAKQSNFFKYFSLNFEHLGLKKLIATAYNMNGKGKYIEYLGDKNGNGVPDPDEIGIKDLNGNGDFASDECVDLLKQADIIVTNPPFSLFGQFMDLLDKHNKEFVIMGIQTAIGRRIIFEKIISNRLWTGRTIKGVVATFYAPHYKFNGSQKQVKEGYIKVPGICWFTNFNHQKRYEDIILTEKYDEVKHPKFDNWNGINLDKVKLIPLDYKGEMGVPLSFLHKWNPEQFEIIDLIVAKSSVFRKELNKKGFAMNEVNGVGKYNRIIIKNKRI